VTDIPVDPAISVVTDIPAEPPPAPVRIDDSLALRAWRPRPAIRLPVTRVERPAFGVVDAHNHLGRWLSAWVRDDGGWVVEDVGALVARMDACGVETIVNLDGCFGAELLANLDRYDRAHPGRFVTFCHADWSLLAEGRTGVARIVASLYAAQAAGARGLKVWKDLGLGVRDGGGALVLPDDPRLGEIWAACGELGLPVLIHTADPLAFFQPVDEHNERLEELSAHPEWSFCLPGLPSWERLLEAFETLVASHRGTTFIGAHVASCAEDLGRVERMLGEHPNLHVDVSARIAELGRQPRAARRLLCRHPDRVLFGTDSFPPDRSTYTMHYRFLESDDECFPYSPDPDDPCPQGRWYVSALDLPEEVLRAVYRDTPRRVLGLEAPVPAGARR
jgi:hypothetical protein